MPPREAAFLRSYNIFKEITKALMEIDAYEYGTAGVSLEKTATAATSIKTHSGRRCSESLHTYLEGMNTTQRDFFSFQWQMSVNEAEQLLTEETAAVRLEENGHGDLDLSQFHIEALTELHKTVIGTLNDYEVNDVWKTQGTLEPFNHWSLDSFRGEVMRRSI